MAANPDIFPGSGGIVQANDGYTVGDVIYNNPNPSVKPGAQDVIEMPNKPGVTKDPQWMNNFVTAEQDGAKAIQPVVVLVGVGILLWLL